MKHKVLLLDFDGVISPGRYFSEIYSEKFGVDLEVMNPFFEMNKPTVNIGKGNLKELLKGVLEEWKWQGTNEELLDFWLNSDSDIDDRFEIISSEIKDMGFKIYLATDQEKYRSEFIWNERGLKKWMDGRFISCDIGFMKGSKEFFEFVVGELDVRPEEILYFDDSQLKVDSAKKVEIDARIYSDFEGFKKQLFV